MVVIAVLGLGEAGRLYARGLARGGADVRGYDPYARVSDTGFVQHDELENAVGGADVVLSLVGSRASRVVANDAGPHMSAGAVFADLNTSAPADKRRLSALNALRDVRFADVAVLAPVPRAGHATPLMVSGSGADDLYDALTPLGVPIESIGGDAGDAASRKLLRSIFMKGLAGVVLEAVTAGRAAGAETWIREQMASELGPDGAAFVDRLIVGSHAHAGRRAHEVADVLEYLDALAVPRWMSAGTHTWLTSLDTPAEAGRASQAAYEIEHGADAGDRGADEEAETTNGH